MSALGRDQSAETGRRWRRVLGVLAAFGLLATVSPSAVAETKTHPVNLAFFFPWSTNQDPTITTHFRLGILYGRVGGLRGVDLSAVVGRVDGEVRALQLTGVHSWIGGDFRGLAATGGILYVGGASRGIQIAGLGNFDRGLFSGVQYGTLFNVAVAGFSGVQLSSFYNLNGADGGFLQVSSVVNANGGAFRGLQLSGILNFTAGPVTGAQVGLLGAADSLTGIQVGLVNSSHVVHGTQVGVVNLSGRMQGLPIGMVNWTRDGGKEWDSFVTSYAGLSTGLRTTVRHMYSIVAIGGGDLDEQRADTFFFSWHLGREFPVTRTLDIGTDAGFVHVVPQPSDDPADNDRLHFAVQVRGSVAVHLGRRSVVYLGGGWNGIYSEYSSRAHVENRGLGFVGYRLH